MVEPKLETENDHSAASENDDWSESDLTAPATPHDPHQHHHQQHTHQAQVPPNQHLGPPQQQQHHPQQHQQQAAVTAAAAVVAAAGAQSFGTTTPFRKNIRKS